MDWIRNLNRALEYIEDNIEKDLTNEIVAKEAFSSNYHFCRMFSLLAGKSLGEYIKERKLTLASQDIISKKMKIVDVALKYGYSEPSAFTKAFKRFHGVAPSKAVGSEKNLQATPPISFIIDVKGGDKIDFRVSRKDKFTVIGTSFNTSVEGEVNKIDVPKFWQDKHADGTIGELVPKIKDMGLIGVGYNFNKDKNEFDWFLDDFTYMIAVQGDEVSGKITEKFEIPEFNWAIFPGKGVMPESIQSLWTRIYKEWFPATNNEPVPGPALELYLSDKDENNHEEFEIWIPVK